jgi:DNA-binding beta-propeller fold protein YncE
VVPRRWKLALLSLCVLGSCGSSDELPPAAEPARSPEPMERPAGRVVPIGNKPEGLVVDASTGLVAVGLTDPDRLALVDAGTGRVERRVLLSESPRHLQLERAGGPVLVPAERANALVRVGLPGGRTDTIQVGRFPHDAAAVGGRIFVGDELGDTVSVIEEGRVIERLEAPIQPGGVVAAGSNTRVAIVAVRERVVEVFDARTLRSVGKADAGVGPTHVVSDGGDLLYVVDTQGDALLLFHLSPRLELVRRVYLKGAPYGITIDRRRGRLWVTLTESNRVVELAAGGQPRVLRSFPTVRQPNTVGVDEKSGRVFVASRTDGTLQLFDP